MLSDDAKREIVMTHYPGTAWKLRVMAMTNKQVHSIFMRLLNSGQLKGRV